MSTPITIKRYSLIIQKTSGTYQPNFKEIQSFLEEHGFHISPRTLQRDIEQIRKEFNLEIKYHRGRNTYHIGEEGGAPPETLVRFLAILDTAEMLSECLQDGSEILNFISFEDQGNLKGIEHLKGIIAAIRNKRKLEVKHRTFESGKLKNYVVSPYLLKEYQGRWYVFGTIGDTSQFRTFGLDRIETLEISSKSFKRNRQIDPKSYFEDVVGLVYNSNASEEVVLHVNPLQAKYLEALPMHKSQKVLSHNDKKVVFAFHLKPNYELIQRVLMMGDRATVAAPAWLAEEMKTMLKGALKNYQK
jgi:predicted DNA-binding transcriptional regulator YafY